MATDDASQDDYFISYADLSVHELMLKDRPRVQAYRRFLESNRDLIKDKIVMDVGAGTGILSLFAASAGAKKVLAVEASSIAKLCQEIVEENKLSHIIEVIHGPVETISLPPGIQHVDVIISEWMGFYLLHESMLDSVIAARDKFLAPDGLLVPSHASLFCAPVDMSDHFQNRAEEWSNVYGFDLSPIASHINMDEVSKPLITHLDASVLCASPHRVAHFDLKTVTVRDVRVVRAVLKFPIEQLSKVVGFAIWFDVEFHTRHDETDVAATTRGVHGHGDCPSAQGPCPASKEESCMKESPPSISLPVVLTTGPGEAATHWKQTVVFLPRTIVLEDGISLCCQLKMSQNRANRRHYNISISLIGEDDDDVADDSEGETDDVCDSDDSTDHPVPCGCGSDRCRLISALVDKYDQDPDLEQEQSVANGAELGLELPTQVEVETEMETAM